MTTDLHNLCGAYAVDALDDDERPEFENHLAQCPHCSDELAGLLQAAAAMSAIDPVAPSAEVRANLLREIRTVRPLPPLVSTDDKSAAPAAPGQDRAGDSVPTPAADQPDTSAPEAPTDLSRARRDRLAGVRTARRSTTRWLALAAAAVVILVGGGVALHAWTHSTTQTSQLTAASVLSAKDAKTYTQKVGGATATVVRSASLHGAVIETSKLPAATSGHVYALWFFDAKGNPIKAGQLPANTSGTTTTLMKGNAATATAVGMTVEKASGWTKPSANAVVHISFA